MLANTLHCAHFLGYIGYTGLPKKISWCGPEVAQFCNIVCHSVGNTELNLLKKRGAGYKVAQFPMSPLKLHYPHGFKHKIVAPQFLITAPGPKVAQFCNFVAVLPLNLLLIWLRRWGCCSGVYANISSLTFDLLINQVFVRMGPFQMVVELARATWREKNTWNRSAHTFHDLLLVFICSEININETINRSWVYTARLLFRYRRLRE